MRNIKDSDYTFGRNIAPRDNKDYAVLPIREKSFLHTKPTGLFVEVKPVDPNAKSGLLGGVVYTATVRGGSPDMRGPNLVRREQDPTIGKNKARRATRAGTRVGEQWFGTKGTNGQIRTLIDKYKPTVFGGRR